MGVRLKLVSTFQAFVMPRMAKADTDGIREILLDGRSREHATEACLRAGVHIYRSRDLCLMRYKAAKSRYLSCSSRCFPIRMFVCGMDRSEGLAISSQEDLFFFSLDIDRSVIDFDQSRCRQIIVSDKTTVSYR